MVRACDDPVFDVHGCIRIGGGPMLLETSWIYISGREDVLSIFCFLFKVMNSIDQLRVYVIYPYSMVYVYMHVLRRFRLL